MLLSMLFTSPIPAEIKERLVPSSTMVPLKSVVRGAIFNILHLQQADACAKASLSTSMSVLSALRLCQGSDSEL